MTIEAAQYISDLNSSYPRSTDLLREGDDHIRMVKNTLQRTFPNVKGSVRLTSDAMNSLSDMMQVSPAGLRFTRPVFCDSTLDVGGVFTVKNAIWGANLELTADTPFVDFHHQNNAADFSTRILNYAPDTLQIISYNGDAYFDIIGRLNVRSSANVLGGLSVSGTINTANRISAPSYMANASVNPDQQGTFIGWNSAPGSGTGNIKVNKGGGGVGGLLFEFINAQNTTVEGAVRFNQNGSVQCGDLNANTLNVGNINSAGSIGLAGNANASGSIHSNLDLSSSSNIIANGALYAGGAGGAFLRSDGNIINGAAWGGELKAWVDAFHLQTPNARITNWHWMDNGNVDFTVDGVNARYIPTQAGSDEKFKENIKPVDAKVGYDVITAIPLKSFKYKDLHNVNVDTNEPYTVVGKTFNVGFLAQDVEKILPIAIEDQRDGKYVNEFPLITNLIAAVQYLSKKVEELEAKLEA